MSSHRRRRRAGRGLRRRPGRRAGRLQQPGRRLRGPEKWYPAINLRATAAALAAAAASGLTAADLGLRRDRLARGRALRRAAGRGAGRGLGRSWPRCQHPAGPAPTSGSPASPGASVAYQVTVRIPVGTVLWEEAAFRGVLQAALGRVLPGRPRSP